MTTINLGVIDQPYSHSDDLGKVKTGKRAGQQRASTTGDIAEILEDKYGIMETFFTWNAKEITEAFEGALQGALESLLMGAPVSSAPFSSGCSEVEEMFRRFIESKKMDGIVDGVPTKASLEGGSHRFKSKKGPVRPSFIDTGMYVANFKCWVE